MKTSSKEQPGIFLTLYLLSFCRALLFFFQPPCASWRVKSPARSNEFVGETRFLSSARLFTLHSSSYSFPLFDLYLNEYSRIYHTKKKIHFNCYSLVYCARPQYEDLQKLKLTKLKNYLFQPVYFIWFNNFQHLHDRYYQYSSQTIAISDIRLHLYHVKDITNRIKNSGTASNAGK